MEDDIYRTIAAPSEGIFKSKGSRFLSFAFPVSHKESIKEQIERLKAGYHDARHHCYAYRLGTRGENFRSSDDGEPTGTAGKPILGQIRSKDLTNTLVVVVRYFGGTLLGTSGLIEAYKLAAADALSHAPIVEKTEDVQFSMQFEYIRTNEVMKLIHEVKATILKQQYTESGFMEVCIRRLKAAELREKLSHIKGLTITE